ncbi:MAG: methyltransferase domain-containing protein [Actinobacteria bacterium]|nr:methyltransferase domain-containing protein [Actinomycetota bacterium]
MSEPASGAPEARTLVTFYSSAADEYQRLWAPELLRMSRLLLEEVPFKGARRVLDVATGVGTLLPEISRLVPGAFIHGVDVAEGMVRLAPEGSSVSVMDAMQLGLRSESFDVGLIPFALFHLPDPSVGLGEMARVISPGGAIGTVTWGDDPGYAALDIWSEELDAAGAAEADVTIARHDLVDTPAKMTALLDEAGFDRIRTWTATYEKAMTAEEFVDHRVGHGMSRRRFDSLGPHARALCLTRVRRRLEEVDREGLTDTSEVIFALARRP